MSLSPTLTNGIHISKACAHDNRTGEFWNTLWVWNEVIAQAVGNTITKPPTVNVQRHCANLACNSDQTISEYYKVNVFFTFVDHVVQLRSRRHVLMTSSRLNSCRKTVDGNEH